MEDDDERKMVRNFEDELHALIDNYLELGMDPWEMTNLLQAPGDLVARRDKLELVR